MASDVNYEGFGLNLNKGRFGNVGSDFQSRIQIQNRVQNVMNAIKTAQQYGPLSPAPYANLMTGFAENNERVLRGDNAKRGLEYPYPLR